MLAFQILGYSLPLICSAKVLFKSNISEAYRALPDDHHALFGMLKILVSLEKILLLVDLLLTARIFQMVIESRRSKSHSKGTSNPKLRYASKVILSTLAIYTFGFLIWVVARGNPDVRIQPGMRNVHMWQQQRQKGDAWTKKWAYLANLDGCKCNRELGLCSSDY